MLCSSIDVTNKEIDKVTWHRCWILSTLNLINQLAAASEEQNATSQQISSNVELINNVTQQATESTDQISRAAENLNKLTINLQTVVNQFKLDNTEANNISEESYLNVQTEQPVEIPS